MSAYKGRIEFLLLGQEHFLISNVVSVDSPLLHKEGASGGLANCYLNNPTSLAFACLQNPRSVTFH